jgi:hypothetical protein
MLTAALSVSAIGTPFARFAEFFDIGFLILGLGLRFNRIQQAPAARAVRARWAVQPLQPPLEIASVTPQ